MDFNSGFVNSSNILKKQDKEKINGLKKGLIESGVYDTWKKVQYAQFRKQIANDYNVEPFHKYDEYLGIDFSISAESEKCCRQIYNARRQKNRRIKNRVEMMLRYNCIFLTMTFTDEVLASTSFNTRRTYIVRFLNSLPNVFDFLANIDFGDEEKNPETNHREHYHALIVSDCKIGLSLYKYGWIFAESVRKCSKAVALAKYVNKLTLHAHKSSTMNFNIITKRGVKYEATDLIPLELAEKFERDGSALLSSYHRHLEKLPEQKRLRAIMNAAFDKI